ncbi:MAG: MFS transporter [Kofleriaceae bacterium]
MFGSARFRDLRATLPPVYWTVWVGTLINRAGAFVAPILTFYLTRQRGMSLGEAGSIIALFGAGTVVASLVGGTLADRLGRKVTMVGSLFGGACAMLWVSASSSLVMIGTSVFVLGFIGDLYRPAVHALVADVVPPEHRQRAYGFLYWAINLGFSIAPVAAGLVATFSYRALFIGDAATSAVFSLVVLARVPETHPDPARKTSRGAGFAVVLRDRAFLMFWLFAMLQACIIFQLTVTLSGWMEHQGYGPGVYGAVLAINGILIVLLQPSVTEWAKQFDRRRVLAWSALLMGAGFALHGISSVIAVHALAVAVWTIGEIFNSPAASSLVADLAPPHARGRYGGFYAMGWGLASCLAPLFGPRVLAVSPALLWGGCAAMGVVCAIGYSRMTALPRT